MEQLRRLPSGSVHTVVTSPPYWGLRDYGIPASVWGGAPDCVHDFVPVPKRHRGGPPGDGDANVGRDRSAQAATADILPGEFCASCDAWRGCLGLEPSPALFVEHMVAVFDEVWRVLRADGTVWLNLGDSYASTPTGSNSTTSRLEGGQATQIVGPNKLAGNLKAKDLVGIPWRVAFALQDYGWYLRQDIIWAKPNPMPESVRDRCTKAHEYLFHLAKSERYYFDAEAIAEPISEGSAARVLQPNFDEQQGGPKDYGTTGVNPNRSARQAIENFAQKIRRSGNKERKAALERGVPAGGGNQAGSVPWEGCTRNKRSVWTVTTKPYKEAHFATFPPELVEPCIAAGTSERGCCSSCGAPYERIVEDSPEYAAFKLEQQARRGVSMRSSELETLGLTRGIGNPGVSPERITTGWAPGCGCGTGLEPDDREVINTPTGERAGEDPSLETGRAGMNRPRGENEGSRPITRYEQRRYAEQLKASPHRAHMRETAGEAFAHYERTDRSGARPIPGELLEHWIACGWLERVELPAPNPPPVVPCTVLDPFGGSGTTGLVADRMQRHAVLIEINPAYVEMARTRLEGDAPLFAEVRT